MSTLALYVQGDIYPGNGNDPQAVVAAITGSKFNTPILALCHVNCSAQTCPNSQSPPGSCDADLTFNDALIVRCLNQDGACPQVGDQLFSQYVGNSTWPGIVQSLRAGNVTKIFASFGGYGVPDYQRIGQIMAKWGTGEDSPLYQNFKCLKETLGIDGIDFDDEDSMDQDTVVQFAQMLIGLGYEITFCPYGDQEFWSGCIDALGADKVSWLNLQCYAGGLYNNPADWTGMGVPVVAGICANCCCPQTNCSAQDVYDVFNLWTNGTGSVNSACWGGTFTEKVELAGGFIWTYLDIENYVQAYVNSMAEGLQPSSA